MMKIKNIPMIYKHELEDAIELQYGVKIDVYEAIWDVDYPGELVLLYLNEEEYDEEDVRVKTILTYLRDIMDSDVVLLKDVM
jgi:hypothetical protein